MSSSKKITIAIDGFSSCGKSTLAKALAKKLNYIFIDSGAMYRAITLYCFRKNLVDQTKVETEQIIASLKDISIHFIFNEETNKLDVELNGENVEKDIRNLTISNLVSKVASIKEVRQKLVSEQQKIGKNGGIVMDGRDIASVVFPNAELKLFITAKPEVRAQRRFLELNDSSITLEDVAKNLEERDFLDTTRKESPLIQVEDAIVIDNSDLTQEEQLNIALSYVLELKKLTSLT
ncbi:MAG: (d)CMP kinase [Bacteroidota bacterium]